MQGHKMEPPLGRITSLEVFRRTRPANCDTQMFSFSNQPVPEPRPTLRERLTAVLPPEILEKLERVQWKWPERHLLDERQASPTEELVAWIWGQLTVNGMPILQQFITLSRCFPAGAEEEGAFTELRNRVWDGGAVYDVQNPLRWETLPGLKSLAGHFRARGEAGIVKDLALIMFSFCPWADEHEEALRAVAECRRIACWDKASEHLWFPPPGEVIFRSEAARAALLQGKVCRISVAIFPDRYQLIAIGCGGPEDFSHKQILSAACVEVERSPKDASQVGGGMLVLKDGAPALVPDFTSETLRAGIPEAHAGPILAAILRAIS